MQLYSANVLLIGAITSCCCRQTLDSDSDDWFVNPAGSSWFDSMDSRAVPAGPAPGSCNTLAITGPCGAGKTAAVAACAQVTRLLLKQLVGLRSGVGRREGQLNVAGYVDADHGGCVYIRKSP